MRKHLRILSIIAALVAVVAAGGLLAQGSGNFFTIDQGLGQVNLWSGGTLTVKDGASLTLEEGSTVLCEADHAFTDAATFEAAVAFEDAVSIESGGSLDVESGATFALAGVTLASTATAIDAVTGASLTGAATTSAADALAIAVTHRVVAKTTGADAEALTLANGVAGQRLLIYLAVDGGGDGTLTPATSSGFATIVFADAGDFASLEYVDDTVGWILLGTGGVAAPPAITL